MQTQLVKIRDLKNNSGQILGLPKNPRLLKDDKFIKLKKSLEDDPEMLELREVIAYDNNGELIVICGNMRLRALKELGIKEVPTKILPTETSVEKLKAYTIKDNISFGDHDWYILANEWDCEELEVWGFELDIPMENYEPIDLPDDFIKKFEDTKEIVNPIAIQIGECSELFLIPIYNKIDESFIRELFNLNETKQSKLIKGKSNVIDIEILKCKMK